ncbi:MAG: hypothetical protein BKP49_09940 [Treponema sp. CETP13]|nr:MAG: hypothetical protein BKP49_09940 [Treponema sp. CETP13]
MHVLQIILIILISLLLIYFVVCWFLCNSVILRKKLSHKEGFEWEHEHNNIPENYENSIPTIDFKFNSPRGYTLYGKWLFPDEETANKFKSESFSISNTDSPVKVVVFSHGHGSCLSGMYKYASMYLPKGFICLVYDHVHEGISEGKYITMGKLESQDLEDIVTKVYEKCGKNTIVGVHGESMGSATAVMHHCRDSRIAFTVADCPYADLNTQLGTCINRFYHLPQTPLLQTVSLLAKIRAKFFFGEVSPITELKEKKGTPDKPLMLVHGLADKFVPCQSSKDLFSVKKGIKKLYLVPKAKHASSFTENPDEYKKQLYAFLTELKII